MNSKTQSQTSCNIAPRQPGNARAKAVKRPGAKVPPATLSDSDIRVLKTIITEPVITKPEVPAPQPLHPTQRPQPREGCSVIKLGLDVDLDRITTSVQHDHSAIKPATGFDKETLVQWVEQRVKEGHVVWTVYEACGFGFTLHHKLVEAGAISLMIAPVTLNTQRRLKNDKLDARELCTRLTRYVDGQKTELPVIRVPSVEEQQRRETARQREFWKRQVQRLAAHGRALRLEYEHRTLGRTWWGPRCWKEVAKQLSPFVLEMLTPVREQLLQCQQQVDELGQELESRVQDQRLPKGLGKLTMALFTAEMCDVGRFGNRKEVGSYTGLCPSQYTSRGIERFGAIDRHGNKHLRVLLIEAVWRLINSQPHWHALKKYAKRFTTGKAGRKKAAVALSRMLAIDLWRVLTGRATWAELGLFPN